MLVGFIRPPTNRVHLKIVPIGDRGDLKGTRFLRVLGD